MMAKDSHHGNSNCRSARQSRPRSSRPPGTSCCRCQGKTIVARQSGFDPLGIHPAEPRFARNSDLVRIAADVLYDPIEMFFVADDSVVGFLLPKDSRQ